MRAYRLARELIDVACVDAEKLNNNQVTEKVAGQATLRWPRLRPTLVKDTRVAPERTALGFSNTRWDQFEKA